MEHLEVEFEKALASEMFTEEERKDAEDVLWGMVNYMRDDINLIFTRYYQSRKMIYL
jgi:hypothetical protein